MDRPDPMRTFRSRFVLTMTSLLMPLAAAGAGLPLTVRSPDRTLAVTVSLDDRQQLHYAVQRQGRPVLEPSRLGLELEGADLAASLAFVEAGAPQRVDERYELQTGKRRQIRHRALQRSVVLANPQGQHLTLEVRVANDGLALRYRTGTAGGATVQRFVAEHTQFRFAPGARAWLQPMSVAKTGWKRTNPSYEEHYRIDHAVGEPAPTPAGWVFPALFRSPDAKARDWVAISEAGVTRQWHGSRLASDSTGGVYRIAPPPAEEVWPGGGLLAESTGELVSPWRVIGVGSLATLVESTLGTDVAPPARAFEPDRLKPGIASWSWALLKDDGTVYDVQQRFIDYAGRMGWRYTLVDADWDRKIGYDKARKLVEHAAKQGVGLWLWYNSSGPWNDTEYSPKSALLTPAQRQAEFKRLREMGVKGVKIDFFGGDGRSMMAYYQDLLDDAADAGLLVNFHGATLPRGWQRSWPNLLTMEAVKGFEFTTFGQPDQDAMPPHAAMLPFTRNLWDPMDYTPMAFGDIPNIRRRTRNGFELAETVLFTSGIQHLAEVPEVMAATPGYVQDFLRRLPVQWDDTRFIAGDPGHHAVVARRAGRDWYVAGFNADEAPRTLMLDLRFLAGRHGGGQAGLLITDGNDGPRSFALGQLKAARVPLTLQPRGGFVAVFRR